MYMQKLGVPQPPSGKKYFKKNCFFFYVTVNKVSVIVEQNHYVLSSTTTSTSVCSVLFQDKTHSLWDLKSKQPYDSNAVPLHSPITLCLKCLDTFCFFFKRAAS